MGSRQEGLPEALDSSSSLPAAFQIKDIGPVHGLWSIKSNQFTNVFTKASPRALCADGACRPGHCPNFMSQKQLFLPECDGAQGLRELINALHLNLDRFSFSFFFFSSFCPFEAKPFLCSLERKEFLSCCLFPHRCSLLMFLVPFQVA